MHKSLFVVGGLDDADETLNDVDVYDPAFGKWLSLPPMPTPRFDCALAAEDGRLFVMGGRNKEGNILDVVESFDLVKGIWETLPPLPSGRFGSCASILKSKLYVFGGWDVDVVSTIEELDLTKEKLEWKGNLPPMPTARGGCTVTLLSQ